jgi:ribosome-associated toxin RatA of RatAB toxin-antitoxin module
MRPFLRSFRLTAIALVTAIFYLQPVIDARTVDPAMELQERLQHGEILVGMKNVGDAKFVTGSLIINEPPNKVWQIIANPYEFKRRISPRMKEIQMMVDKPERSVMRVEMDVVLIPHFNYVVESNYQNGQRIDFHRLDGTLKDFKGSWEVKPIADGRQTELSYAMYLDPGFFVPQWLMREGVKSELPKTLEAVRKRVVAVVLDREKIESHTIAAGCVGSEKDDKAKHELAGTAVLYK